MDNKCSICGKRKAKYTVKLVTNGDKELPTYQVCGYCIKHPDIFINDDGWRLSEEGRKKVEETLKKILSKKYKGKKITPAIIEAMVLDVLDFYVTVVASGDYEMRRKK